jgi:hypothetical protein
MSRPGIILYDNPTNDALAYCELASGPGRYTIRVPRGYTPQNVYWVLVHNLIEIAGRVSAGWFYREDNNPEMARFEESPVKPAHICVSRFSAVDRPRNVTFANYGETTPDGLRFKNPEDVTRAYYVISADERLGGRGRAMNSRREHLYLTAEKLARSIRQFLSL